MEEGMLQRPVEKVEDNSRVAPVERETIKSVERTRMPGEVFLRKGKVYGVTPQGNEIEFGSSDENMIRVELAFFDRYPGSFETVFEAQRGYAWDDRDKFVPTQTISAGKQTIDLESEVERERAFLAEWDASVGDFDFIYQDQLDAVVSSGKSIYSGIVGAIGRAGSAIGSAVQDFIERLRGPVLAAAVRSSGGYFFANAANKEVNKTRNNSLQEILLHDTNCAAGMYTTGFYNKENGLSGKVYSNSLYGRGGLSEKIYGNYLR
ncbi:MAG: hypothetical protein KC506_00370 [Nanoarchaeota archaeon]|nr:hypothetical protein [Nanoarchaeota archaeon]